MPSSFLSQQERGFYLAMWEEIQKEMHLPVRFPGTSELEYCINESGAEDRMDRKAAFKVFLIEWFRFDEEEAAKTTRIETKKKR